MFWAVQAAVEAHKAFVPSGAPLLAPCGTFAALLGCLDRGADGGQQSGEDAGPAKNSLRADVITACLRFAAVLRSHGNATGNEDMQADGKVSRARLEAVPDDAFPGAAHNILCWMDRLSSSVLADYGIEPAEVPDTYAALSSFSKCTEGERRMGTGEAADTGDGPRIVAALVEILETMMDPAVESMAIAQPNFYREYFAARISIVTHDVATAPKQKPVTVAAAQPAANTGAAVVPVESRREDNGRFGFYAQSA
jgi:hypothetical protein